jgi:quinoprotein glucose dehydrogenase
MRTIFIAALSLWLVAGSPSRAAEYQLFAQTNLVAWCIVPFDAKKRGPEERAQMLENLKLHKFAYDYRAEHVPTFDAELAALKKHHVELTAWWFPTTLNAEAKMTLELFARHKVTPQLWVNGGGAPTKNEAEQRARIESEAKRIRPIAEAAAKIGCQVALYNHDNWYGDPDNQIAIVKELNLPNVGIVYNFHHGHDDMERFAELMNRMKPHLLALNLNGMVKDGKSNGNLIMPIGQGDRELGLIRIVRDSGWRGLIGILNHTNEDAEARLKDNLAGLKWIVDQLDGKPAGPKPVPTSWKAKAAAKPQAKAVDSPAPPNAAAWQVEDPKARAKLPEFQTLPGAEGRELTTANGLPRPETFRTWERSLGDAGSRRYSSLSQINRDNVKDLQVAWTYRSGDGKGNIQCNPIIVNGVMFAPTVGRAVVAVDAETGKELWRFKPELPARPGLEDTPARRGLLFYPGVGIHEARILFTCGKWIYAVTPKTGQPVAEFGTNGRTEIPTGGTAIGAVFKHVFVIPGFDGDVFGYDVHSGKMLWRFHTIPKPGEFGHETWKQPGVGANCWGGMALDDVRGIAYIPTGSPKPNFLGMSHQGDNLFANCLIALDAMTGRRLWHFQEIRHDIWDLDLPAPPNLVTITREGRKVDAVACVSKTGYTLLLDRVSGKPIFPFRLRRAPVSQVPGEVTAPYQPDPEWPQPFARQAFSPADVTERTPEAWSYIQDRVKSLQYGWYQPVSDRKVTVFYGVHGGAEWTGSCVDHENGRLYVSANEIPWLMSLIANDEPKYDPKATPTAGEQVFLQSCAQCHGQDRMGVGVAPPLRGLRHRLKDADVIALMQTGRGLMPAAPSMSDADRKALLDYLFLRDRPNLPTAKPVRPSYVQAGWNRFLDLDNYPANKPPWGTLNCLDLNTGQLLWKVPLGEYPELTEAGIPKTGTENFGGPIVTAGGLIFCAGTRDEKIRAFDKDTGEELWSAKLPWGGNTIPSTYEFKGRQYVVIPATGGGKLGTPTGDAYVAFALPK